MHIVGAKLQQIASASSEFCVIFEDYDFVLLTTLVIFTACMIHMSILLYFRFSLCDYLISLVKHILCLHTNTHTHTHCVHTNTHYACALWLLAHKLTHPHAHPHHEHKVCMHTNKCTCTPTHTHCPCTPTYICMMQTFVSVVSVKIFISEVNSLCLCENADILLSTSGVVTVSMRCWSTFGLINLGLWMCQTDNKTVRLSFHGIG